ncbi:MAG: PIG-L family deacetylase [Acholeplasmatales bacterium]|nr:PIG-L family deacetylase [Acholeplasmatales bacterium]
MGEYAKGSEKIKKVIMAIGGHIGDAELTAGGVLASMSLEGHKIVTVALTGGEKGNPPHIDVDTYRIQKEREAKEFAEMLGGEAVVLPYKDGELPDNEEVRFMVADIIRKYKPDVVITHWKNSMHKDHSLTHKIVKDAKFYAALPGFKRENPPHYAAGPFYAENWKIQKGFIHIIM